VLAPIREDPPRSQVDVSSEPKDTFSLVDFALFHHFTTDVADSVANDPILPTSPWRSLMPGIAPRHPYLLREMLALAAIHKYRQGIGDGNDYLRIAQEHHGRALEQLSAALSPVSVSDVTQEHASAIFGCSALIVNYYFTEIDHPAAVFFNASLSGPPEWIMPIRGCGLLARQLRDQLYQSPAMAGFLQGYERPQEPGVFTACDADDQVQLLRMRLEDMTALEERAVYEPALDELRVCFTVSERGDAVNRKLAALRFPTNVHNDFIDAMSRQKKQWGLVIMAFWLVLMGRISKRWWLQRKWTVKDAMDFIVGLLTPQWAALTRWPAEQVSQQQADPT